MRREPLIGCDDGPAGENCDFSPLSFMRAWAQLDELPTVLRVSGADYDLARRTCPGLAVEPMMATDYEWELIGRTRIIVVRSC
jgi:hypothetical protein